jgi:2-dehydropantoate 2-reductase
MTGIAVLGPGGVGGFLAGALERAGTPVTVVAHEGTAAAIERDGLQVTSARLGEFEARPSAVSELDATGCTVIVATKSTGLAAGLDRIRGEPVLVVPLLNGLDHLELLRERFGDRAVAASIRIESTRVDTGRIEQTSRFLRIDVAPPTPAVERFAATMDAAGVPVRPMNSVAQVMWGKLVRLNAIACATSAFDLPLGPIRTHPELRAQLRACVEEAAAVARAEGAEVDADVTMGELDDAHPELDSSLHRDIEAGNPTELDAIAGAVLRAAARHGLDCPTIASLAARAAARAGVPAPTG